MPIEEMATRGRLTMRFGPLRGAGLTDPQTDRWPFAAVQLRAENLENTMFNLVGFQTRLKWGEQTRVLRLIPGLENVEIVRFGVIHKNIFLNSPSVLRATFQSQIRDDLLIAGRNAARVLDGSEPLVWPRETVLGSLSHYITSADAKHFQPMNSNWALLPPLEPRPDGRKWKKDQKAPLFVERGQKAFESFVESQVNSPVSA